MLFSNDPSTLGSPSSLFQFRSGLVRLSLRIRENAFTRNRGWHYEKLFTIFDNLSRVDFS
jgi:hypothetical protein